MITVTSFKAKYVTVSQVFLQLVVVLFWEVQKLVNKKMIVKANKSHIISLGCCSQQIFICKKDFRVHVFSDNRTVVILVRVLYRAIIKLCLGLSKENSQS